MEYDHISKIFNTFYRKLNILYQIINKVYKLET